MLYRGPRKSSGMVVATNVAVHYKPPEGAWRCVAWADAVDVRWAAAEATLTLRTCLDGPRVHRLAADAKLAALADERVAHAHLIRRRVELLPDIFGVVEAVLPADDALPVWRVLLDDPVRRDDPTIAQACHDAIAAVRSVTG